MPRSKGQAAREKGKTYELHVASEFRDIGWDKAARRLEFQKQKAIKGRDLDNTQPFAIQCKSLKKTPSIMALNQIIPDDEYPIRVAFLKRTQIAGQQGMHVAVVDVPVFLEMVKVLKDNGLLTELLENLVLE